jgi:putative transposase
MMKRFKSARQLQRFVSIHDPIANLFNVPRYDIPSAHHRKLRAAAMEAWCQITLLHAA